MAKKHSTRRKARKPKFIEVDGHQLTPTMYASYKNCVESRKQINGNLAIWQIEQMALNDFLSGWRPSRRIGEQIAAVYDRAMDVSLAMGPMKDYNFFSSRSKPVVQAGSELLRKLGLEMYNVSARITALAMNVEAEADSKLQDWIARDEAYQRIGRMMEVTHG
jgi:hypothetical protein